MMSERLLRIVKAELKRRTGQEVPDSELEKAYESLIEQGKVVVDAEGNARATAEGARRFLELDASLYRKN